ncbi:MAG: tetratricopeptide repeat protein [Bacteroidota bacterium]
MKNFKTFYSFIGLLAAIMLISSCSEKVYVSNAQRWAEEGTNLDTALKSIEAAKTLEKTKDWPKTYYVSGLVHQAIAKADNEDLAKQAGGEPLLQSFDDYKKAYNMEGSGVLQTSIDANLISMSNEVLNEAIEAYNENKFEKAYKYFTKTLEIKKMPVFGEGIDTAIMYNAAIAAQRAGNLEGAIKYYKQSAEHGYGEATTYILLKEAQLKTGDTTAAVETIKEGFEKYPKNKDMLGTLINYYLLESDNAEEALRYLEVARKQEPENAAYYSAEASIYDKMGKKEKAIEYYKKAIEINPELFEAQYNLGVIFYNDAVEASNEANEIKDNEAYQKARAEVNKMFKEALPYIEKAHELQPEERSIMTTLKTLYYRLKMEEKYQEMDKKLK